MYIIERNIKENYKEIYMDIIKDAYKIALSNNKFKENIIDIEGFLEICFAEENMKNLLPEIVEEYGFDYFLYILSYFQLKKIIELNNKIYQKYEEELIDMFEWRMKYIEINIFNKKELAVLLGEDFFKHFFLAEFDNILRKDDMYNCRKNTLMHISNYFNVYNWLDEE